MKNIQFHKLKKKLHKTNIERFSMNIRNWKTCNNALRYHFLLKRGTLQILWNPYFGQITIFIGSWKWLPVDKIEFYGNFLEILWSNICWLDEQLWFSYVILQKVDFDKCFKILIKLIKLPNNKNFALYLFYIWRAIGNTFWRKYCTFTR